MEAVAQLADSVQQERTRRNNKQVAAWLMAGIIMVVIQIALGGITRLTGSGLSITEWEVVTGSVPPLNEAAWLAEFDKYKGTPQFQLLNSDFTLSDFKFIYFWEWMHRLWGRMIGLVFAVGFIYFLVAKKFQRSMVVPLVILFALGGVQSFVGWIMVASGLTGDAVYVKPTRLALHFIFAMGLLCYTWWFYLQLRVGSAARSAAPRLHRFVWVFTAVLTIQLMYGALMAGHKAATAAPTWPTINGAWVSPAGLYQADHGLLNFIDNKITVHLVHRTLAYLLLAGGIWMALYARRQAPAGSALHSAWTQPLFLMGAQVLLGILSVLTSTGIVPNTWGTFEWMAQLHQLTGMAVLLMCMYWLYLTKGGKMKSPALA